MKWVLIAILSFALAFMIYRFDRLHTDLAQNCVSKGGTWLDRNLMCIDAKEIK